MKLQWNAFWTPVLMAPLLLSYLILAVAAHRHAYFEWDLALTAWIQSVKAPLFEMLMVGVSILGRGWVPVAIVGATGALLILARRKIEGIICMTGVGLGFLLNRMLKLVVGRPRPSDNLVDVVMEHASQSFPSGHVVLFVEFFGFLLFLIGTSVQSRAIRILSFVVLGGLIGLVGVSRVYLGAHWPSDVLGGYLSGAVWLGLMIIFYRRRKSV